MELTKIEIDNLWLAKSIITILILPLLLSVIESYYSRYFNKVDLHAQVKGVYKDFLKQNSRQVDDLFNGLYKYKTDTLIIIRVFSFLEGCLIGIILFLVSFQCFFHISQHSFFNGMPPFSFYYNYLNADNIISEKINGLYLVSSFNLFSIFGIMFCGISFFIIDSRGYLFPKHKEDLSLLFWSKISYHFYYFLIGVLIGINLLILLFSIGAVTNFHSPNQRFSFSLIYFVDILANLITQVPIVYLILVILCYIAGIFLSIYQIYLFSMIIIGFSVVYKHKITSFYIDDLPHIHIKTEWVDISGQLRNVQNESLMILSENDVIKAIPWNQIKLMEIKNKEENSKLNMIISPETNNNKSWWKFW